MNEFLSVEDLNEDDLNAILGLSTGEEKAAQLEQQLAQAMKLRNQQGPEGRMYGNMYTAANPLEHVAHVWQGINAQNDADRLTEEQNQLMQDQMEGRKRFFEAMMLRRKEPLPQEQPSEYGPEAFGGVY